MNENTKTVLGIIAFLVLLLALKPELIGITAGSMTFTETFSDVWLGLGRLMQTVILLIVFVVIISFVIGSKK